MTRMKPRLCSPSVPAAMAVVLALISAAPPAIGGMHEPALRQTRRLAKESAPQSDTGSAPSSSELDHFVHAVVDVGNIKRAARPAIVGAASQTDRTKLEQATVKQIKAAIRGNDLSVHRYLQIAAFVQTHKSVQKTVLALMKQLPIPPPPPYQPLNPKPQL